MASNEERKTLLAEGTSGWFGGAGEAVAQHDPPELQPLQPERKSDWLRTAREAGWHLSAVTIFVWLGAGQALAARASVAVDGSLPYDTAAAVACAEVIKLVIAVLWVIAQDRHSIPWPLPREWAWDSFDLFFIAVLFAATNELNFMIVERLGAALFMILGNLKIVFTCIFMRAMLQKEFAPLQWLAVAMLTISAVMVKAPTLLGAEHQHWSSTSSVGIVLILLSTACSGLASVKNELVLKKQDAGPPMPFMAKNAVLYLWGVLLNLGSWGLWGSRSLTGSFTPLAWTSILCLVGLGLACAVILRYLDNVVRCFSSVAQVLLTVALSRLLPARLHEGSFGLCYALALVLLSAALVVYQAHQSPFLLQYLALAISCSLSVALGCGAMEKWMAHA